MRVERAGWVVEGGRVENELTGERVRPKDRDAEVLFVKGVIPFLRFSWNVMIILGVLRHCL